MIYAAVRAIDTETLGLAADAGVCEIGWTDIYATSKTDSGVPTNWQVEKNWHSLLVNPGRPIPPEAQAVHHISDEDVADAPDLDGALQDMLAEGRKHVDFTDADAYAAHNAKFDRQFLDPHLASKWICSMRCWQHVDPDAPGFGNQTLRYHLKPRGLVAAKAMPPHRAGPDSYVTAHLVRDLLNRSKPNGERNTVERLVKATERVPLLKICPMGDSWRGKPFEALDTKALRWLATKPDGEEIRATARHWLNERGES